MMYDIIPAHALTHIFLALFGALPPRELKLAQKKAKETLQSYVEAANQALEILRLIQS